MSIVIYGAGGHAKVVMDLIGSPMRVAGIIDKEEGPSPFPNIPLFAGEPGLRTLLSIKTVNHYVVALGDNRKRVEAMDILERYGLTALTFVHNTAFVSSSAILGPGCQVLAQSAVCAAACLGRGTIINTGASVDHDCKIGKGVHVAPGARLGGEVTVGDCAFVGMGAVILPRLTIGEDAIVGAGAVVTKDVAAGVTVVGCPARVR